MEEIKELFLQHYETKQEYLKGKYKYDKLIEKKAMLVISTQPKATSYDKELVKGGIPTNKFENVVEKLEQLDPEIIDTRNKRDKNEYYLKKIEIELKDSDYILDRIYYLKYIKRYRVRQIAININYSTRRTYQMLQEIKERLHKIAQNCTK